MPPSEDHHITAQPIEAVQVNGYSATKTEDDDGASGQPPLGSHSQPRVQLTRAQFVLLFIGLALSILLAALDQTIVSTAIPTIVTEFQSADLISWVGTGYLLTAAAFSPIYGKIADTFGRKWVFLTTILIFEAGSLICGIATSMEMLIVGRVVQGLGGGGIFSLVLIIISDIVSFEDQGKYQGIIGAVFGLSSVVGPLAGGGFTDSSATWRWSFLINLPIGAITVLVVLFFLKFPPGESDAVPFTKRILRIDYLGVVLLVSSITALLLPLQLGGTVWEWQAPQTIALFIAFAVLLVAFWLVEYKVSREPVIPTSMFISVSVYASTILSIFLGASFLAITYYVPLYFQVVQNDNATISGLKTIPLIGGVVIFSIVSGQVTSRTGRIEPFLYIGGALTTVGTGVLSTIDVDTEFWKLALMLLVSGIGVGCLIQTRVLAAQAVVHPSMISIAVSLSTFTQTIGAALGIAIFGVVFSNKIYTELIVALPPQFADPAFVALLSNSPNAVRSILASLPNDAGAQLLPIYLRAFVNAMRFAFYAAIPLSAMIFVCALFVKIPSRPLQKGVTRAEIRDLERGKSDVSEGRLTLVVEDETLDKDTAQDVAAGGDEESTLEGSKVGR